MLRLLAGLCQRFINDKYAQSSCTLYTPKGNTKHAIIAVGIPQQVVSVTNFRYQRPTLSKFFENLQAPDCRYLIINTYNGVIIPNAFFSIIIFRLTQSSVFNTQWENLDARESNYLGLQLAQTYQKPKMCTIRGYFF